MTRRPRSSSNPYCPAESGATIRLGIRPEDVTLARPRERLPASSARNVLEGTIARITVTDLGVHVLIDCGFLLVATVTLRSLDELGLAPRHPVLAMCKATAVHVISVAASLDTTTSPAL